jgi:hypothetical protein
MKYEQSGSGYSIMELERGKTVLSFEDAAERIAGPGPSRKVSMDLSAE